MNYKVEKTILSFYDIPAMAKQAERCVMLVRHSYRQSLKNGNYDAVLTEEGRAYARECGALLAGLESPCFGSSPLKRSIQTAQELMTGGNFEKSSVAIYPEIRDSLLFKSIGKFEAALDGGDVGGLLKAYYFGETPEDMLSIREVSGMLMEFLSSDRFERKNAVLISHDIVINSLLMALEVYPFTLEDWCGYIQGAALFLMPDGNWSVYYTVPDLKKRGKAQLFI